MSEDHSRFAVGTIVTVARESNQAGPTYQPGDTITLQSSTGGTSACRVTAVTPETNEVACVTMHYRLTPAAATLEVGGMSSYGGAWVVRSVASQ